MYICTSIFICLTIWVVCINYRVENSAMWFAGKNCKKSKKQNVYRKYLKYIIRHKKYAVCANYSKNFNNTFDIYSFIQLLIILFPTNLRKLFAQFSIGNKFNYILTKCVENILTANLYEYTCMYTTYIYFIYTISFYAKIPTYVHILPTKVNTFAIKAKVQFQLSSAVLGEKTLSTSLAHKFPFREVIYVHLFKCICIYTLKSQRELKCLYMK